MPHLEFEGGQYEVDEDGYLVDWESWKEGMAPIMAAQDGVTLGNEHWQIIKLLREYFIKFQIAFGGDHDLLGELAEDLVLRWLRLPYAWLSTVRPCSVLSVG